MAVLLQRDGNPIADQWTLLADDEALPAAGPVIVSLDRLALLLADGVAASRLGVKLANTLPVEGRYPEFREAALVQLDFPAFPDGRAYSQARLLSGKLGYTGRLRAAGAAVVLDQLLMLASCGFTEFALREDQDAERCGQRLRDRPRSGR